MRCETRTPFGRPVVPDVYMMAKGSSAEGTARAPVPDGVCAVRSSKASRETTVAHCRAAPQAEMAGTRSGSATMTRGSACESTYARLSPRAWVLTGTQIAPARAMASIRASAVSLLRSMSATRSPVSTPLACSHAAQGRRACIERAEGQIPSARPAQKRGRGVAAAWRTKGVRKPSSVAGRSRAGDASAACGMSAGPSGLALRRVARLAPRCPLGEEHAHGGLRLA